LRCRASAVRPNVMRRGYARNRRDMRLPRCPRASGEGEIEPTHARERDGEWRAARHLPALTRARFGGLVGLVLRGVRQDRKAAVSGIETLDSEGRLDCCANQYASLSLPKTTSSSVSPFLRAQAHEVDRRESASAGRRHCAAAITHRV
jgi:hypothetical protein